MSPVSISQEDLGPGLAVRFVGIVGATAGAIGAVLNPEGVDLLITKSSFWFKTKSTGAANLGVGVAANATTKGTDVLNDLAVGSVTSDTWYNGHAPQATAKTQISAPAVWAAGQYLTFTGSGDTTGLEGYMFVEYVRKPAA